MQRRRKRHERIVRATVGVGTVTIGGFVVGVHGAPPLSIQPWA